MSRKRFERSYRFVRLYLRKVICRCLDCGNLRNGLGRCIPSHIPSHIP